MRALPPEAGALGVGRGRGPGRYASPGRGATARAPRVRGGGTPGHGRRSFGPRRGGRRSTPRCPRGGRRVRGRRTGRARSRLPTTSGGPAAPARGDRPSATPRPPGPPARPPGPPSSGRQAAARARPRVPSSGTWTTRPVARSATVRRHDVRRRAARASGAGRSPRCPAGPRNGGSRDGGRRPRRGRRGATCPGAPRPATHHSPFSPRKQDARAPVRLPRQEVARVTPPATGDQAGGVPTVAGAP